MNFKYYIILSIAWVCICFPLHVFGQYIQKETVDNKIYAVIYSEGLAESARWGVGFKMTKNGATIRHQVDQGNEGNILVNDKIPMRFIVAPTDVPNDNTWMEAEGVLASNNGNLGAVFSGTNPSGCFNYSNGVGKGRKWRLPTQRELQLMWMFREPIGIIYPNIGGTSNPMGSASTKKYWAATEKSATEAWYFDFTANSPACSWQAKNTSFRVRCVSDY